MIENHSNVTGNNESIDEELLVMKAARKHMELNPFVWSDLLEYHVYAPLGIVILLMVGQQFCGVNLLFFNLNAIFKVRLFDVKPTLKWWAGLLLITHLDRIYLLHYTIFSSLFIITFDRNGNFQF